MNKAQIKKHEEVIKNKDVMESIVNGIEVSQQDGYDKPYDIAIAVAVQLKNAGFTINRVKNYQWKKERI